MKVFLVVLSVGLSWLVAEAVLRFCLGDRLVLYPRFHDMATYGEYTIRRLRPNTTFWHRSVDGAWKFTTNSKGFRASAEYSYDKPKGVLRVLCLGDSHTQGFECHQDKTYASIIQRFLESHGIQAEVINAGVSGFSTAEALVFLEHEGIRYAPDVVVLGYFANDVDDNIKSDLFRLENGRLINHRFVHAPGAEVSSFVNRVAPLRWLSQNSYVYSTAFNAVWEIKKRSLLNERERAMQTEFAVKQEDPSVDVSRAKNELAIALVRRMHGYCQSKGIFFILVDLPQPCINARDFQPSIPGELATQNGGGADVTLHSAEILRDDQGVADIFVPHGQHHISETTHLLIGIACAKEIVNRFRPNPPQGIPPRQ